MVPDESDDDEDGAGSSAGKSSGKKERFFWQYNVQAKVRFLKSVNHNDLVFLKWIDSFLKGPKGQKIVVNTQMEDPHVLNDIVDPVFSGDVQLQGIKHRYVQT